MYISSEAQKQAINQRGKFVLHACPGSGKTFLVARRFAERIKQWKSPYAGIATLSFTNVASTQIGNELANLGLSPIPHFPHILGTIDHFINTYIFMPHGHLVTDFKVRPSIVGLRNNFWDYSEYGLYTGRQDCYSCKLAKITFDINGNLVGGKHDCPFNYQYCGNVKVAANRMGFATQSDAEYYAMIILGNYPKIARTLARRFPEMIIDEAQDTSEIQMRIIDLLVENGLSEVMLVGDPDQAIYEWRDAKPDVFKDKFDADGWKEALEINENRRSSQEICNLTKNFSASLKNTSRAVGEDMDIDIAPILLVYDPRKLHELKDEFIEFCQKQEIEINNSKMAILVRSNSQLRKIRNVIDVGDPWNYTITRLLAHAVFFRDIKDIPNARNYIEAGMARLIFANRFIPKLEIERRLEGLNLSPNWSVGLWKLLRNMPNFNLTLRNWKIKTSEVLNNWFENSNWPVSNRNDLQLKVKARQKRPYSGFLNEPLYHFFNHPKIIDNQVIVETIHSAKGKTYEAVLYIVNDSNNGKGNIKHIVENELKDEEVRIAYVAMTRPKKILVVAVPNKVTDDQLAKRFPNWMIEQKRLNLL